MVSKSEARRLSAQVKLPSDVETGLLTRAQFRLAVFTRDKFACVLCGRSNVMLDAHHIMERRLFDDGGYYRDNGVTLCDPQCHMRAESNAVLPHELRERAGITRVVLPPHLYEEYTYDKWGNIAHDEGDGHYTFTPGELFTDPNVQKVLSPLITTDRFRKYIKYPRTYHLPWSPGATSDDRRLPDTSCFDGRTVWITEKMDGENTTMYRDHIHARSLDPDHHPSRAWVKNLHASIAHDIPEGWRICGENLYAEHSIHYKGLPSYFLMFSIWNADNVCLSVDETQEYAKLLGLDTVYTWNRVYYGEWNEGLVRAQCANIDTTRVEGLVVRVADAFPYGAFRKSVAKWVRANHVQSAHNWKNKPVVKNEL